MNAWVSDWDEPIAALFPLDLSGDVVALRACIDASRLGSGVFSVAGVAFGYDRAVKANAEWGRLMKGRTFHMTDFNARQGDFKEITRDETDSILVGVIRIIRDYSSYFGVASCDEKLITEPLPTIASADTDSIELRNGFRTTYGLICHVCMSMLGDFAGRKSANRSISYILELGDPGQKGLVRYLQHIQTSEHAAQMLDLYSLSTVTTASKGSLEGIFHAADLVAWEWSRYVAGRQQGKPMRKSLAALTGQDEAVPDRFGLTLGSARYLFRHFDARNVDRLVRYFRETIEAKAPDEVKAAMSGWESTRFESPP